MPDNPASPASRNFAWGGRFDHGPDKLAQKYTDSQHYDRELYHEDILASKAHAKMCAQQGILDNKEAQNLVEALDRIEREIEAGQFVWREELEDVHMNIEARLVELIGETGKKLHTGRSRNDQVGLDFRLYVAGKLQEWRKACANLVAGLCAQAEKHVSTIMPGYTHLQPAQPVALAHHLLAYAGMFSRDAGRIGDALGRVRISPLGAAALAGSTFPLDPEMTAREVGFDSIYANSMDAVSDRDFVLEAHFIASAIMMHVSRLCEEIILWANPSFGFVHLPDSYATGSSIMPQKKNPDVAELARGKTGRVYGHLMAMLTVMKGLPLAYNRDLQEDKEGFFDSNETVLSTLRLMRNFLESLEFQREKMLGACAKGYINATELADYLTAKGIPFRSAHHITGQIVAEAEKLSLPLEELPLSTFQKFEPLIGEDVFACLQYANAVARRESPGGTGPASIRRQLDMYSKWLEKNSSEY